MNSYTWNSWSSFEDYVDTWSYTYTSVSDQYNTYFMLTSSYEISGKKENTFVPRLYQFSVCIQTMPSIYWWGNLHGMLWPWLNKLAACNLLPDNTQVNDSHCHPWEIWRDLLYPKRVLWVEIFLLLLQKVNDLTRTELKIHWNARKSKRMFLPKFLPSLLIIKSWSFFVIW